MNNILKNSIRFVLFLLIQIIILNEVPPLHQFITPYLYFTFILWLPFGTNRLTLTILGFLLGYCLDVFTNTPGLHAAAATLVGYVRPTILNLLLAQETSEEVNKEPSVGTMGWGPFLIYVFLLTFIHHFYLVLLEWLQFGNFTYFIGKVIATSLMSVLLILLVELVMNRRNIKR
jgi:cell shape-determining protein MreD